MSRTWAQFKATARSLLKDRAGTTAKWSDPELLEYANWGLADLSRAIPLTKSVTLTGGGPDYDLPSDFMRLNKLTLVASGMTMFLKELREFSDTEWQFETPDETSLPLGYVLDYPDQDHVYVTQLTTEGSLTLQYDAILPELMSDADVIPVGRYRWAYMALCCYMAYCAELRDGVSRAQLEQWAQKTDASVGNPLNVNAAEWLKAYNRLVSENRKR